MFLNCFANCCFGPVYTEKGKRPARVFLPDDSSGDALVPITPEGFPIDPSGGNQVRYTEDKTPGKGRVLPKSMKS